MIVINAIDDVTVCPDTVKYKYEKGGLRIFNVIPSDGGTYECCAEVTNQGNFKVKPITLSILCKCKQQEWHDCTMYTSFVCILRLININLVCRRECFNGC